MRSRPSDVVGPVDRPPFHLHRPLGLMARPAFLRSLFGEVVLARSLRTLLVCDVLCSHYSAKHHLTTTALRSSEIVPRRRFPLHKPDARTSHNWSPADEDQFRDSVLVTVRGLIDEFPDEFEDERLWVVWNPGHGFLDRTELPRNQH
jgi:hypothetical protein